MAEGERPFYHRFAWAYDLLVDDPVEPWLRAVEAALPGPRATVLDAGCGTGRHAVALAVRGHVVTGVDASRELLDVAGDRARRAAVAVHLVRADLRTLDLAATADAVACRGVLNDLLEDRDRAAVLGALARHVRQGGALVLDVRDHDATARRYGAGTGSRRSVDVESGRLTFAWRGRFDRRTGRLAVDEEHRLREGDAEEVVRHAFAMRCWSPQELRDRLDAAGFTAVALRPATGRRGADRIVATARRPG
jgi:SAM-dependent methyltransferase